MSQRPDALKFLYPGWYAIPMGLGGLSLAYTLSSLLGGLAAPFSGWLLDRFGPRPVLGGSLVLGGPASLLEAEAIQSLLGGLDCPVLVVR